MRDDVAGIELVLHDLAKILLGHARVAVEEVLSLVPVAARTELVRARDRLQAAISGA
jgi:hypothetical protein